MEAIASKPGLWGIVIAAVVTIILIVAASLILWALGLIVAVTFGVIGCMFIYFFHKIDFIDAEKDKEIWVVPFAMFLFGFVADHIGILSVQPLSVVNPVSTPITWILLVAIVILLIVDILVSRD